MADTLGYLEPIRAAGAVLRRGEGGDREVALIHRPKREDWTLPKGKLKNSEHILTTAVREVEEETGIRPVLGRRLGASHYTVAGWPKRVEWWSATVGADLGFVPGDEVDTVEWVRLEEARERLSYDHDIQVLDSFAAEPGRTVPIILQRHASAGRKQDWEGEDLLRPLDAEGRGEARALSELLAVFGRARVVTSAAARCVETIVPYAVDQGVELRMERAFTVGARGGGNGFDRSAARVAFSGLVAERRPTVVCTHGELVADLLREALIQLGSPISQQLSLLKGAFWVLHVYEGDGSLAALERHVPGGY